MVGCWLYGCLLPLHLLLLLDNLLDSICDWPVMSGKTAGSCLYYKIVFSIIILAVVTTLDHTRSDLSHRRMNGNVRVYETSLPVRFLYCTGHVRAVLRTCTSRVYFFS